MLRSPVRPEWQWAILALAATALAAAIVAFLYWAQAIVIPFALAVFFAFVLAPVVARLEALRLGRVFAVVSTVGLTLIALGAVGWILAQQAASLTRALPDHAENIKAKVLSAKAWVGADGGRRMGKLLDEVSELIAPAAPVAKTPAEGQPLKVVVAPPSPWIAWVGHVLDPLLALFGQIGFALILVVFILIKKEDLRDRLIRVACPQRVAAAMKALDDASSRMSRYLLVQLALNAAYGVLLGAGLALIGVKYALLWGFLAGIARYVPYLGIWLGAVPPILFALATADAWLSPLLVAALIAVMELITVYVLEPWLYGASLGMSAVAQLTAAAFWAFLWGPVGLVLSSPLAACLVILGKHVPQFKVFAILLGDEPPLEPGVILFERLSARDQDEAARVLLTEFRGKDPAEAADRVVIPALQLTKSALRDGDLAEGDVADMVRMLDEILFEHHAAQLQDEAGRSDAGATDLAPARLLACPAQDEADRAALDLLLHSLDPRKWEVRLAGASTLAGELTQMVEDFEPAAALISSLPPGGAAHARYLCKRLRQRGPEVRILLCRWGESEPECEQARAEFEEAGANEVLCSVTAARGHLQSWRPAFAAVQQEADDERDERLKDRSRATPNGSVALAPRA